jgi:hypothetical protein
MLAEHGVNPQMVDHLEKTSDLASSENPIAIGCRYLLLGDLTSSHLQHVHQTGRLRVHFVVMDAAQTIHDSFQLPRIYQTRGTEARLLEIMATTGSFSN